MKKCKYCGLVVEVNKAHEHVGGMLPPTEWVTCEKCGKERKDV